MVGTALAWGGGIVWGRSDLAFTLSNVVAHGLPYVALVAETVPLVGAETPVLQVTGVPQLAPP